MLVRWRSKWNEGILARRDSFTLVEVDPGKAHSHPSAPLGTVEWLCHEGEETIA